MREKVLIDAMEMHDQAINSLRAEFKAMQKIIDRTYVQSLTHVMMWDCLLSLLDKNKILLSDQFNVALKELSDRTKATMKADEAKSK